MVFPGWVADPDARIREIALEEICPHFQRAGAAQRLDGCYTLLLENRVIGAKQQRSHGMAIAVQPFHRQIQRRAVRLRVKARFGLGHRLKLRNNAIFVVVQADAEVNFVAARIFFKAFH